MPSSGPWRSKQVGIAMPRSERVLTTDHLRRRGQAPAERASPSPAVMAGVPHACGFELQALAPSEMFETGLGPCLSTSSKQAWIVRLQRRRVGGHRTERKNIGNVLRQPSDRCRCLTRARCQPHAGAVRIQNGVRRPRSVQAPMAPPRATAPHSGARSTRRRSAVSGGTPSAGGSRCRPELERKGRRPSAPQTPSSS